ncbi:hypothetical protein [Kallotenue papyrolyticum]|uniref:hypothetical protein n=1 Tax=Kallotenue papyrolyticum TaxID=1325125 RepID=UPI0004785367|nr:hypothetical protein [Kallotenue papyrolyticum]
MHDRFRLIPLLMVLAALGLAPALPARAALPERAARFALPGLQSRPRTDGTTIVWIDGRTGDPRNSDIYGANLADGRVFPIATGPADQSMPAVDNGLVIWEEQAGPCPPRCDRDIRGRDLRTGQSFEVAATPAEEAYPDLVGGYAVWVASDESGIQLRLRDLRSMSAPITLERVTPGFGVQPPLIAANRNGVRVLWLETGNGRAQPWRLRLHDRPSVSPPATLELASGQGLTFGYDLDMERVALATQDGALTLFSLELIPPPQRVVRRAPYLRFPTLAGPFVFWSEQRPDGAQVLRGAGASATLFNVADGGDDDTPFARNGLLVWSRTTDQQRDVFATRIADALPTARRPAPERAQPDLRYFSTTGHNLAFGFKAFWERNGGLPVFGYPLSEEFDEFNVDRQQDLTVQYVERQRLEYHPDLAGTPYEVQLGRLGAWILERQGRRWEDQPRADPSAPHYFPATGQAITHAPFWQYWRSHGLELGDPGVSEREALALFGYPLTPAQTERNPDGDLVLTQWFERARFEWHPNNPTPYRVLLGRLGAELLVAQGFSAADTAR